MWKKLSEALDAIAMVIMCAVMSAIIVLPMHQTYGFWVSSFVMVACMATFGLLFALHCIRVYRTALRRAELTVQDQKVTSTDLRASVHLWQQQAEDWKAMALVNHQKAQEAQSRLLQAAKNPSMT